MKYSPSEQLGMPTGKLTTSVNNTAHRAKEVHDATAADAALKANR